MKESYFIESNNNSNSSCILNFSLTRVKLIQRYSVLRNYQKNGTKKIIQNPIAKRFHTN